MILALVLAFLAGLAFGAWRARSRGGGRWDMATYAVAHGFAALVLAAFAFVVIGLVLPT